MKDTTLCVFAKPPTPGKVKTRLLGSYPAPMVTDLARAFLADTWATVSSLPWAMALIASTEDFDSGLNPKPTIWLQGEGDLGDRLMKILNRGLSQTPLAMAVGADSPGIPVGHLHQAHRLMLDGADAVLGPSEDGGFYLLAVRDCPAGLLSGLPWSQSTTCEQTQKRLRSLGKKVALAPPWFDVDRPEDLERLVREIGEGGICAPFSQRVLGNFGF